MSRCRQTDQLLDATFAGTDLTRVQAEHVRRCAECARAMSQARRFENELGRTALDLAPEPMPAALDLAAPLQPTPSGGRSMSWRRGLLGAALSAVVVAVVVFGGGRWLGSLLEGRVQVGTPTGNSAAGQAAEASAREAAEEAARVAALAARARGDAEVQSIEISLDAWLAGALRQNFVEPPIEREGIDLVRAEHCGNMFTAVFTEVDTVQRDFFWVAGVQGDGSTAQGGTAIALDGSAVAAARGTTTEPCSRIVDDRPIAPIMEAVTLDAGVPEGVSLLATTLLDPALAVAVVDGENTDGNVQRWMGLVRLDDGHWSASPNSWIGTNIPANDGLTAWDLTTLDPSMENQELLVGALPAGARTIELIVDGTVYRYEADARGIVIAAPEMPIDGATFRILDVGGDVIVEGSIRR